ncbi:MAG: hypothetical protein EPO11_01360 [Gammaproteobacteria bacterium]|nr:MAG: hypothetical protein EPO11_01360 [Gammaproteobacteria bacterium]
MPIVEAMTPEDLTGKLAIELEKIKQTLENDPKAVCFQFYQLYKYEAQMKITKNPEGEVFIRHVSRDGRNSLVSACKAVKQVFGWNDEEFEAHFKDYSKVLLGLKVQANTSNNLFSSGEIPDDRMLNLLNDDEFWQQAIAIHQPKVATMGEELRGFSGGFGLFAQPKTPPPTEEKPQEDNRSTSTPQK